MWGVVWGVYCHIVRPCASASHVYVTDVTLWRYNTVHVATCYLSMLTCRVDLARCLLLPFSFLSWYFMDRSDVFRHACARLELWIHFARHRAGQQLQSATSLLVSIIFEMRCHYMLWIMLWDRLCNCAGMFMFRPYEVISARFASHLLHLGVIRFLFFTACGILALLSPVWEASEPQLRP